MTSPFDRGDYDPLDTFAFEALSVAGTAVGFTAQQNDADVFGTSPTREHQTNTTGFSNNWNSSEQLTGLILGPKSSGGTGVKEWSLW